MPIALRFLDNVKRAIALWHIALVHCTRTKQMRGILPRICFSFACGHFCPLRFGKNKCDAFASRLFSFACGHFCPLRFGKNKRNAFALRLFSFACGRSGETCRKALPSVIASVQTCLQSKRHTRASCLHSRPPYSLYGARLAIRKNHCVSVVLVLSICLSLCDFLTTSSVLSHFGILTLSTALEQCKCEAFCLAFAFSSFVVGVARLELAALRSRTVRATKLRYTPLVSVIKLSSA